MDIVIVNDVWEYNFSGVAEQFKTENIKHELYFSSFSKPLVPFIAYKVDQLRYQGHKIIHCPSFTSRYYENSKSRINFLNEINNEFVGGFKSINWKQANEITINENDYIANCKEEIEKFLNKNSVNNITILGFHLNLCIYSLIKMLYYGNDIKYDTINLVANCTLPSSNVNFDDWLDYFKNEFKVNIIHI